MGQKLRGSFYYREQFLQRGTSSYQCPEGFGVGFGWAVSCGKRGKRGRGWGGWGGGGQRTGKGTGKSMRKRLSELPFSKLPFEFSFSPVGSIYHNCRGVHVQEVLPGL